MRKVYVLHGGCIDDRYVVAVYTSKKKAEEGRERRYRADPYYKQYPDDLWIEEFELNKV